jgi:hypothetical protein
MDRLIKYTYMILYLEANTAEDLAYAFLRVVVANHGNVHPLLCELQAG